MRDGGKSWDLERLWRHKRIKQKPHHGAFLLLLEYNFCHLISLSRSSSSASALCLMTVGALSGSPPMRINATGAVIRSLGGIGQSIGAVDVVEQPAISHAIAHSRSFDSVTVDYLSFDYGLCASVFGVLL